MNKLTALLFLYPLVLQAAPHLTSGYRISPSTEISVVFDEAVVKKDQLQQKLDNNILEISPKWPGKLYWKSQNVAIFHPSKIPSMDQQYSFKIKENKNYLSGNQIKAVELGKRSTFEFEIRRSRKLDHVSSHPRPRTFVAFTDHVTPNALAGYFIFQSKEGKRIAAEIKRAKFGDIGNSYYTPPAWTDRWAASFAKQAGKEAPNVPLDKNTALPNCVIIRPVSALPVGNDWTLQSLEGIPNKAKNSRIKESDSFQYGTKDPLSITHANAVTIPNKDRFIQIKFNLSLDSSINHHKLKPLISITPELKDLKFERSGAFINVYGNFYEADKYSIEVKQGIPSANGLNLTKSYSKSVEFEHVDASMAIPSFSTAQLTKGQRKYPIETVNMKHVRVRVKALTLKQAIRTQQGYSEFLRGQKQSKGNTKIKRVPLPFSLVEGKVIYDEKHGLKNKIDTSDTLVLDWDKVLPTERTNLVFFLDVQGTAKDKVKYSSGGTHHVQSFIQLTDIGLAWKISDEETLLYCYSCETGKPLPNVQLSTFGEDAGAIEQLVSDQNGVARLGSKSKATHLAASLGEDTYILSMNQDMSTVGLWRFPVKYDWYRFKGWKRETLIFTDRKLYKPGETAHIKGMVREKKDNQSRIPLQKKAKLSIYDSSDRILVEQNIELSEHGSFDHTLQLPANNVGTHRISLEFEIDKDELADDDDHDSWERNWLLRRNSKFSSFFSVQEFRKNAFKVSSQLSQKEDRKNTIKATISANYYMGTSVAKGKLDWYLTSTSTGFYPEKHRGFYFGNHLNYDPYYWDYYYGYKDGNRYSGKNSQRQNGSAELGKDGSFSLELNVTPSEFPSPQQVSLLSEVTDGREQTISSRSSVTLHPSSHYIGIGRIDKLLRVGEQNELRFIVVDNQGKESKIPLDAELVINRVTYETTKVRSADGKITIHNKEKKGLYFSDSIKLLPKQVNSIKFNPDKAGRYTIEIKAKDSEGNAIASATRCQVYGSNEYPWAVNTGMKIELAPEQKHYKPGDTARILVKTPIEGTALITVERNGVLRHMQQDLLASKPVIEVPLGHEDAPNVYVSVLVIRGSESSPHKFKEPALKLGYCNLNVENIKDRLNIAIDSPEESYRPDAFAVLSGTISDADGQPVKDAELTFYAEDNGVLDVIGYQMPRPLKYFNQKIALAVDSGTSLHTFLQEMAAEDMQMINKSLLNKGYTIGGGGGEEQIRNKVRKNFDPCAFWNPTLKTDAEGRFSLRFKTPESLTSYRVMAIATAGGQKFGSADSEIVVNKPLMIEPLAPRFANEGDTKRTKLYVANNSKHSGTWKVTLKTGSLTHCIDGDQLQQSSQMVDLKAGSSIYLNFDTKFVNTGMAKWTWQAEPIKLENRELNPKLEAALSDAMENKFEVLFPRPIIKTTQFSQLGKEEKNVIDKIEQNYLNGRGKVELELCNNLLFRARGAADHLLRYPYGCVEQTSSSLSPWFAVRELKPYIPAFQKTTEEKIKTAIQKGADRLLSMQTSDGGLAYWPGGARSEDWATSYGGHTLILAKRNGADVPQEAIDKICNYLSQNLHVWIARKKAWDYQSSARTLYTLSLAGKAKQSDMNLLFERRENLNTIARCYLALAMHELNPGNKDIATLLEEKAELAAEKHWMRFRTDKQLRLKALCKLAPDSDEPHKLMASLIKIGEKRGHWGTAWANASTVSAMAEYSKLLKSASSSSTFTIKVDGEVQTVKLDAAKPSSIITLPLQKGIKIAASVEGPGFCNVIVHSKPAFVDEAPTSKNGVAIDKNYFRILADGTREPLKNPKVGDLVEVELDVTFSKPLHYVVIDDPLPGTFECVNSEFASQSTHVRGSADRNWTVSNQELRDDRALFFLNYSWGGKTRKLSYLARITSSGEVTVPAAKVEAMYDPDTHGLTGTSRMLCLPRN